MPADFLAGALSGIGEKVHQKNLLEMQRDMDARKMAHEELIRQGSRPDVLQEAQQGLNQAAMDVLDPKKKWDKVFSDAMTNALHVHVKAGSPDYPQQQQQIQAENMPIASQLEQKTPQVGAPQPPPEMHTPPPSSFSATMPQPPPVGQSDIVRSGFRSPQEMAQMEASAAGLKSRAVAEGQMPAKVAEAEAVANAKYRQKMLESEASMTKAGYRWKRDPLGEFTSEVEAIPKEQQSAQAQAGIEKTQAQTGQAQATTALRQAQTASEPVKRSLQEATIEYRKAQTDLARANADPNSPMNQYRRAQIANLQSLVKDRLTANDPASMDQLVEIVRNNPDVMHEFPAKDRTKIALALQARGYAVPRALPQAQQTQEFAARMALDSVNQIRQILQQYPDIVGPVMGRVGLTEQEWGSPVYTGGDPAKEQAEQQLRTQMTYLLAQESKAVMGGRVPQQWLKEMQKTSPNPAQAMSFLEGSLKGVETNANNVIGQANNSRFGQGTAPAPKAPPADYSVTYQGKKYTFKTQKDLDGFKGEVGIK